MGGVMLDAEKVRQDVAKIIAPAIERQKSFLSHDNIVTLLLLAYFGCFQWVIAYLLFR